MSKKLTVTGINFQEIKPLPMENNVNKPARQSGGDQTENRNKLNHRSNRHRITTQ